MSVVMYPAAILKHYAEIDPATLKKLSDALAAAEAAAGRPVVHSTPAPTPAPSTGAKASELPAHELLAAEAVALAEERGIPYGDAMLLVVERDPQLAQRYLAEGAS